MAPTLLLADTSRAIHRLLELTFEGKPIEVVAVPDGASALARLQSAPPDIILADIAMPAPTGYDIAAHVKQTPALSRIPVLLLTGAFEPVDPVRARACGCEGVLAKPLDPEIVVARVDELLHHAQCAVSTSRTAERREPGGGAEPRTDLDAYFEKLDESLTALSLSPPPPRGPEAPPSDFDPGAAFADSEPVAARLPAFTVSAESRTEESIAAQIDPALIRAIVERVAERLIRAEIERIKGEIDEK